MRVTWMIALSIALAAACGGNVTTSGGASGNGGASGGGASGGTSGVGGTSGSGANGGTSSAGTSGSGGGGGDPKWFECSDTSECQLFANNCCGGYCSSNQPISGWAALNSSHVQDYSSALCNPTPACPDCIATTLPYYAALCRNGCEVVDIRKDIVSDCSTDSDCRLRWGSGCCEACNDSNPNDLVAVAKGDDYLLCGNAAPPCCAPAPYPPDALSVCNAGHCQVSVYVGP